MAGINAALKVKGKDPLILGRDQAYIGVMIDDLVTKGTQEPYRLLTSRAEHRLLLRHDNAELRLSALGHQVGLLSDARYQAVLKMRQQISDLIEILKHRRFTLKDDFHSFLKERGYDLFHEGLSAYDCLKRPRILIHDLKSVIDLTAYQDEVLDLVEIEIKYEGYIAKALKEVERLLATEHLVLPKDIDYTKIDNLSIEGRQKLSKIRPLTLGQAARISGVNPADLIVLKTALNHR